MQTRNELKIENVPVQDLKPSEYNARKWSEEDRKSLSASLEEFGFVQPIVVNSAPGRHGVVIGGNFKLDIAKKNNLETVPVVFVNIPDIQKEKKLNLRLNRNQGSFDYELLEQFEEAMLEEVGFSQHELDSIFNDEDEIAVYNNVISFTVNEEQHLNIKSALDLVKSRYDLNVTSTGKRGPKQVDYLVYIINEWKKTLK